jgi:hypothetical protein
MTRKSWIAIFMALAAIVAGVSLYSQRHSVVNTASVTLPSQATQGYIIRLGASNTSTIGVNWSGSISVDSGSILQVTGWRLGGKGGTGVNSLDTITGTSWSMWTRLSQGISGPGPIYENGVIVTALPGSSSSTFTVTPDAAATSTFKAFSFKPSQLSWGVKTGFLCNAKGASCAASVEPTPVPTQVTAGYNAATASTSYIDQDFPATAKSGSDVWVSYVAFTHNAPGLESFSQLSAAPTNFSSYARAPGGDQVFLMHYSSATRAWDAPVAVSGPNQDVMRTAVAVDGQGKVWVFWSANSSWPETPATPAVANFDIYAQCFTTSPSLTPLGSALQLTTDPGTDVMPVATTDSNGNVWVAWQAFRGGNLKILASVQSGAQSFTPETVVSFSSASNWDPAIAANPKNGEVAISWDTYDKGDYDVYFRRATMSGGIQWLTTSPVPVAASTFFEAKSSIVYDQNNRLWVAYEQSADKWGKDWGAYDTTGIALYQSHTIKLKVFDANSNAYTTAADLNTVLPTPNTLPSLQTPPVAFPDDSIAQNRKANAGPAVPTGPKYNFPRLAVDAGGQVYLAYRATSADRNSIGTIWNEHVMYYDGAAWHGPATLANSDQLLDNRPGLVPVDNGDLLVVMATDHRQSPNNVGGSRIETVPETIQNDIYASELIVPATTQQMSLTAIAAETVAQPDSDAPVELASVTAMRNYRASINGQSLQPMRGEFHRHSEISFDGGSDGALVDQYRYIIDAANRDWTMCCDHDNGTGREYSWWIAQKLTDAYTMQGRYAPLFGYERSVGYPEGHRNTLFPYRGIRPLPRLPLSKVCAAPCPNPPSAPDTAMFYNYLRQFGGITASHTSATNMGTDWRNNDPVLEPVVEIYQGDRQNYEMPGAPRSITATDAISDYYPEGFISLALQKGYYFGFESSSDHVSTHMSTAIVYAPTSFTKTSDQQAALMAALEARHTYAATDNIIADVRCGTHFMGDVFTVDSAPVISVNLTGTANFANVYIIKDGAIAYSVQPNNTASVSFTWQDPLLASGQTSYYYVRGEQVVGPPTEGTQVTGQLVWSSPMYITRQSGRPLHR